MQRRWLAMQANLARLHGMQRRSDAGGNGRILKGRGGGYAEAMECQPGTPPVPHCPVRSGSRAAFLARRLSQTHQTAPCM
jgi:hypothetical protein